MTDIDYLDSEDENLNAEHVSLGKKEVEKIDFSEEASIARAKLLNEQKNGKRPRLEFMVDCLIFGVHSSTKPIFKCQGRGRNIQYAKHHAAKVAIKECVHLYDEKHQAKNQSHEEETSPENFSSLDSKLNISAAVFLPKNNENGINGNTVSGPHNSGNLLNLSKNEAIVATEQQLYNNGELKSPITVIYELAAKLRMPVKFKIEEEAIIKTSLVKKKNVITKIYTVFLSVGPVENINEWKNINSNLGINLQEIDPDKTFDSGLDGI